MVALTNCVGPSLTHDTFMEWSPLSVTGDHSTTDPWVYDGIILILIHVIAMKQHC